MGSSTYLQIVARIAILPVPVRRFTTHALLLGVLLALAWTLPASAGTMTLYSCRTPTGRAMGTTGWTSDGGGTKRDDCDRQPASALVIEQPSSAPGGWVFTAAPNTTLESFEANACLSSDAFGFTWFYDGTDSTLREVASTQPNQSLGCQGSNIIRGGGPLQRRAAFYAFCLGSCQASVQLRWFKAIIGDSAPPVVSGVRGSLVTSVTQDGPETVTFDARDVGVGVFRAIALARDSGTEDYREIAAATAFSARCKPVAETVDLHEFAAPQPCPLVANALSLTLEPGVLPVGEHEMKVVVEDAAGNQTSVLEPRTYTVPAPPVTTFPASAPPADPEEIEVPSPAPAPASAARPPTLARLSITSPQARPLLSAGAFRLTGRLLDGSGNPIAHVRVQISTRAFLPKPRSSVGSWAPFGGAETDASGAFRATIPAGPSRSVLVSYNDISAQADVSVAAQISVRARSTRVRNGHSAVLSGRVLGPLPAGGAPVGLEVREGKRWIPVATTRRWVKTSKSGRFELAYHFRRTRQPATYRFRVVADEDSAFQYTRGASRAIDIHVRP